LCSGAAVVAYDWEYEQKWSDPLGVHATY